jgi:hypothetical protein
MLLGVYTGHDKKNNTGFVSRANLITSILERGVKPHLEKWQNS